MGLNILSISLFRSDISDLSANYFVHLRIIDVIYFDQIRMYEVEIVPDEGLTQSLAIDCMIVFFFFTRTLNPV